MNSYKIIKQLKEETNNLSDIIYREKYIGKNRIYIIYNEPLTSSNNISDFIMRSLNTISNFKKKDNLFNIIKNDISNFKVKELDNYNDICLYLHRGFTIILVNDNDKCLALETKADLYRSIETPEEENTIRGAKDSFTESYQTNIGLIKRRIKTNDLWIDTMNIGKYTDTQIGIVYVNNIAKPKLVKMVKERLNKIDIYGVINAGIIKNLITKENDYFLPTIITTERPDVSTSSLLEGKVVIVIDNCPFVLIMPGLFNDYFKTPEDVYNKSVNTTFTRILKYITFFIALLTPAIYIALITYNQEMIPTKLLISFAVQRDGVPFPAFVEAFMMITAFEILRESDLRNPTTGGSALSIVGALILGEAAVNAGIVSPIMIIVIALTAICSLPFAEPEVTSGLRWYRLLFMLGGSFMGVIGVVIIFIYFLVKTVSTYSFGIPYIAPYSPTYFSGLKDSIIKLPLNKLNKRDRYLSNNIVKERIEENDKE